MAEQTVQTAAEVTQFVNFRLGCEEFGVDISSVKEITRVGDITHIPKAPSFILGVTNLRGQILAVIDLAEQFGMPPREKLLPSARIMITEIDGCTIGILVDAVPAVVSIPVENIEPPPEAIRSRMERGYIKGVGKSEEGLIIILDIEKVLAAGEAEEAARIGRPS